MRSLPALALLAVGCLALAGPVRGQTFRVPSADESNLPTSATQGVVRPVATPNAGFYGPNPYFGAGYNPYGWTPWTYLGPTGGTLTGLANFTNAQGDYLIQQQQSRMLKTQADTAQLDLNRRIFEEQAYERRMTVTAEQVRQFERQRELERSRADPPRNEIWSAKALNDLFGDIKDMHTSGLRGPDVPLDPDLLKRLNLTDGTVHGSAGLFRDLPLRWPLELQDDSFSKDRTTIDKQLPEALRYAAMGRVDAKTFRALTDASASLRQTVRNQITTMSPSENIRANRYLNELDQSLALLRQPNVANFFNGRMDAQGKSVGELVAFMTQNGLSFAPVTNGDESYYQAFYQSLRTYDSGLFRSAGSPAPR
jgi:hypothetical protein